MNIVRTANTCIISCAATAAAFLGVVHWRPFRGGLGAALLFILGTFIYLPVVTVIATIATIGLLAHYRTAWAERSAINAAVVVLGIFLSLAGLATCVRMIWGLVEGVPK